MLYVQLVSFFYHCSHSTYIRVQVIVHFIHSTSPLFPISTYLAPSSCDRNGPPQSQVACKLSPLSPIAPTYPSLPHSPSPLGFSRPNVLLIRTHPNPFPSVRHSHEHLYLLATVLGCIELLLCFKSNLQPSAKGRSDKFFRQKVANTSEHLSEDGNM